MECHHIIDDLIENAPYYLDTLEEIAFTLGDITDLWRRFTHCYSENLQCFTNIYDLSQTVAGLDGNARNLDGRLTVNAYSQEAPNETVTISAINGDISLNRTLLMYNKDNIIIGNASTGDTIKGLDSVNNHNYASKPRGNIIIGSSADIS